MVAESVIFIGISISFAALTAHLQEILAFYKGRSSVLQERTQALERRKGEKGRVWASIRVKVEVGVLRLVYR